MTPAVPLRARFAGWRCLLLLALVLPSLPAAAQAMACGTYKQEDGSATLRIESEGHGFLVPAYSAIEELRLARDAEVLGMVNLATGRMENWTFGEGDRTLTGGYHDFVLEQPAACTPGYEVEVGSCRADPVACLENLTGTAPVQLRQWCSEDVPAACKQLIEHYQSQADEARPDRLGEGRPAFCDPESDAYDEDACLSLAKAVVGEEMGKALFGMSRVQHAALPAAQLVEVMSLCRQHPREDFCETVANAQWNAGRLLEAREALQHSCSGRADAHACRLVAPLAGLSAAALAPVPASTLPCGTYQAQYGVPSGLRFGDAGVVEVLGYSTRLRARVQDGRIHLRRDLGDDIVLQPVRDGSLVGMDGATRFAHYARRADAVGTCSAPVVFKETPLPLDCPTLGRPGAAAACCKAGQLLGCKMAATESTDAERWDQAQPYFVKLCTAGIREGCLGLANVYEHTADPEAPRALSAICAQDGSGTHIACDVDATRNWPAMRAQAEESKQAK